MQFWLNHGLKLEYFSKQEVIFVCPNDSLQQRLKSNPMSDTISSILSCVAILYSEIWSHVFSISETFKISKVSTNESKFSAFNNFGIVLLFLFCIFDCNESWLYLINNDIGQCTSEKRAEKSWIRKFSIFWKTWADAKK